MEEKTIDITGWKMLNQAMCTEYNGKYFPYPAPKPEAKWSEWMTHPEPANIDDSNCGPGRYHIMITRGPDASYAPKNWWPWFAQGNRIIGSNNEKAGVTSIRLRRITPKVFWRIIRFGWCMGANLRGANLRWADLRGADLIGADLRWADLSEAKTENAIGLK